MQTGGRRARCEKESQSQRKKLQKPAAVCNFINGEYSLLFAGCWVAHTGAVF